MTTKALADYTIIRVKDVCTGQDMLQTALRKVVSCESGRMRGNMNVDDIPVPSMATIKVSKENKSAVFETTVIHTTDNKYIYCMPVRVDEKLVNFEAKGMLKELKIEFAPFEFYAWKNISIIRFVEDGKSYLRIKTTTPGVKAMAWPDKPVTTRKKKKAPILDKKVVDDVESAQTGAQ